jgi:ArsR family transcriptional regulator, arsenate/arsenite/antimonite-responsive transcriptional repressor
MSRSLSTATHRVEDEQLANFARALSHPVRIQILHLLKNSTCCYTGDLTDLIPLAQSTISQHLKALKDAGLIQGEIMPPRVKYCIHQENWKKAAELFLGFYGSENTIVEPREKSAGSCSSPILSKL